MNADPGRRARRLRAAAAFSSVVLLGGMAHAQGTPPGEPGLLVPGRSLVGVNDATATVKNPANLGFLPAAEARWMWTRTTQSSEDARPGHSFDLALPLFFNLAAGARLDLVRPPDASRAPDYRVLTGALGWASEKTGTGLGVSFAKTSAGARGVRRSPQHLVLLHQPRHALRGHRRRGAQRVRRS